jgi:hypothetical protein
MPHWRTRYVPTCRTKVNTNRRHKNRMWNISGRLTITTAFLHCMIPLTEQLNTLNTGYEEHTTKTKISHLLYVDDLKLTAKSEEEFQRQIQKVKTFSDDINMEFGLEKCVKITLKRGKLISSQNID